MNNRILQHCMCVLAVVLVCMGGGCATESENRTSASGNPEADRRADLRIGRDEYDRDDDDKDGEAAKQRTLYERVGGRETLVRIVDDLTQRVIADPRVNFERQDVDRGIWHKEYTPWKPTDQNIARFKKHMLEFLTLASGGPAEYTGREMRSVHEGMNITNNEFDAFVGDMKATMDNLGIDTRDQRDLLAIVETTRKQIVEER